MLCRKCRREIPSGSVFCNWCGLSQKKPRKTRRNGEGSVSITRSGKWKAEISTWRNGVCYYATKSGFSSKREAEEAIPALREKVLSEAEQAADVATDATMQELYDEVTARWYPRISKRRASRYRTAWNSISKIHDSPINGLRYTDLQPLIDERKGGYYPKKDIKTLLSHIYKLALKHEYVDKDYSAMLALPPAPHSPSRDALTPQEVQLLWDDYNAGHVNTRYFLIMCYTGMRTGEILTIRKSDIHLREHYCGGGIKTEAGKKRQIVFCDKIMPLVKDACNENEKMLCELSIDAFYEEWHTMVERTGLRKELVPYCCRHTAPTMLAEEGVQPAIIQQIMGHTSYATTAEHYTHISFDAKLEALNKLK